MTISLLHSVAALYDKKARRGASTSKEPVVKNTTLSLSRRQCRLKSYLFTLCERGKIIRLQFRARHTHTAHTHTLSKNKKD